MKKYQTEFKRKMVKSFLTGDGGGACTWQLRGRAAAEEVMPKS